MQFLDLDSGWYRGLEADSVQENMEWNLESRQQGMEITI